jgi:hypothetical protein
MSTNYQHRYESVTSYSPAKEALLWVFFVFFATLSFLGFSLLIQILISSDWSIAKLYSESSFAFFISIFPFYLLGLALFFLILAVIFFVSTAYSFRFPWFSRTLMIPLLVFSFSLISFYSGAARYEENLLDDYSLYPHIAGDKEKIWQAPQRGLLSGEIAIIKDRNDFLLVDFAGKTWHISGDARIEDDNIIRTGNRIRLIGRIFDESSFLTREIRPY